MNIKDQLTNHEFKFLSRFISERSGIKISDHKKTMMQTRLLKRINELKLTSFKSYVSYLKNNKKEETSFVNLLTTNKTDFFRENDHFEYLQKVYLPQQVKKFPQGKVLSIWSAACSTGQEVYTLAIIMKEFCIRYPQFDYMILGTDINTKILRLAELGVYSAKEIQKIPTKYLLGNFNKDTLSDQFHVSEKLKNKVRFKQFNLIKSGHLSSVSFDLIFLRNVLIYFPDQITQLVINNLYNYMRKGSYLFLGHSENLNHINHKLNFLQITIYKRAS